MAKKKPNTKQEREGRVIDSIIRRSVSQQKRDMADWRRARQQAENADSPKRKALIELYQDIALDALLSSQIEQRIERSLATPYRVTKAAGEEHEEATQMLASSVGFQDLLWRALETPFWGHTLIELSVNVGKDGLPELQTTLLPRAHVLPSIGKLLFDATAEKGVYYRELPEYGVSVLEFGDSDDLGIYNKAVPPALFKRNALSSWSELGEIYGIPPRYLKTNTTDMEMLARAEAMMRDWGRAMWAIIDTEEELDFAQGIPSNGDIYDKLIAACNSELSLLVSGAQLGQDTKHGNRSKEEIAETLLERKAVADRRLAEGYMNTTVLPALSALGFIEPGLHFEFVGEEDQDKLWERTIEALPYYEVDAEWIKNKFGIEVKAARLQRAEQTLRAKGEDFFV